MDNVTIAFRATGGHLNITPGPKSNPKGARQVMDGGPGDLDGKKNGQVKLSLPTNEDFGVADGTQQWTVTQGKVSSGNPQVGAAATRSDANRRAPAAKLVSGQPVPRGYKGKTTLITLHGSLVPPNSQIQVSSSDEDRKQTGWKGMTVHDNSSNDLAGRIGGTMQFRVPTGPDGSWSGEIRILQTQNSNGVLFIRKAGTRSLSVTGRSAGKNVPISLNTKNPRNPTIKARDPATVAAKPATPAQQNTFLRNISGGLTLMMGGDLRPSTTFESARFRAVHGRVLSSRLTNRPAMIASLPKHLQAKAGELAADTIKKGGTVASFIQSIKAFGTSTRENIEKSAQSAYDALVGQSNPLLNPSFMSSTIEQLVAGGLDYAGKLRANVADIEANLAKMNRYMRTLERSALPTDNYNLFPGMRSEVIKRLSTYYAGAASTMERVIADHKGFRAAAKKQGKDMAILSGIAALAALGSVGFAYSNTLAVIGQVRAATANGNGSLLARARATLTAPNLPADGGSATLFIQNTNNARYFNESARDIKRQLADWQLTDGKGVTPEVASAVTQFSSSQSSLDTAYQKYMAYLFKYADTREFTTPVRSLPPGVSVGQFLAAAPPADPTQNHEIGSIYSRHYRNERVGSGRGASVRRVEFFIRHTWYSQAEPPPPRRGDPPAPGRDWAA